jgi:hypothetical protein
MNYAPAPGNLPKGLAIASMVLGILSLVGCCLWPISGPIGVVAVALGFMAKSKADSGTGGGKGMAIAGLVCGIIGTLLSATLFVFFLIGRSAGEEGGFMYEFQKSFQEEMEKQQQNQSERELVPDPEGEQPDEDMDSTSGMVEPPELPMRSWLC